MKKFVSYCLLFCLVTFSLAPLGYFSWARAADGSQGGLMPCGLGNDPCTICDLLVLANNIFGLLVAVSVGIAILLAVVAGILYITSGGSSRLIALSKRSLKYVLIGFAVSLLAWVFVNMLAATLGYKGPDKVWWDFSDITCVWETKEPLGIGGSEFSTPYLSTDLDGKSFDYNNLPNFHVYANNADGSREDISDQVELAYSSVPGVELVPGEDGGLSFSLAGATNAISQGAGATQQGAKQASLLSGQSGLGMLALLLPLLLIFKLKNKKGSGGIDLKNILKNVLTLFLLINLKDSGLLNQLGNGGLNNGNQGTGQQPTNPGSGTDQNPGSSGCPTCPGSSGNPIGPGTGEASGIAYRPDVQKCTALNPNNLNAAQYFAGSGNQADKRIPFILIAGSEYANNMQFFNRLVNKYAAIETINGTPVNTQYFTVWKSEDNATNNCPVANRSHIVVEFMGSQRDPMGCTMEMIGGRKRATMAYVLKDPYTGIHQNHIHLCTFIMEGQLRVSQKDAVRIELHETGHVGGLPHSKYGIMYSPGEPESEGGEEGDFFMDDQKAILSKWIQSWSGQTPST